MIFIGLIIASTLIGGGFFIAFYLGFKYGLEHRVNEANVVELDEQNKEAIKEITNWLSYGGK